MRKTESHFSANELIISVEIDLVGKFGGSLLCSLHRLCSVLIKATVDLINILITRSPCHIFIMYTNLWAKENADPTVTGNIEGVLFYFPTYLHLILDPIYVVVFFYIQM